MQYSSVFKKIVASVMVLVNLAYPVAATAGQYMGMVSVKDLIVTNGAMPPVVNIDTSNASSNTFRAGGAVIKVSPGIIAYGIVTAGKSSPPQTITLSNLGSATAQLGNVSGGSQFTATNNCDGATLPPLGTCQLNIAFAPTQVANLVTDTVIVPFTSGTSSAQAVVHVSGTAVMPEGPAAQIPAITVANAPDSFPLAIINQQSFSKTFTIRSTGSAPLQLRGMRILGDEDSFSLESSCAAVLEQNSSCDVTVTFAPITVGNKSAQVQIDTNAFQGNAVLVPLSGQAIEVYPVYGAGSTSSIDFGNTTIAGGSNVTRTVTISNSGTAGLHATFSIVGDFTSNVSFGNNGCQEEVPAGGTCSLELILNAASPTVALGHLVVTHDGRLSPTSPVLIPFSGEVIPQTRALAFNPVVSFGNVDINSTATQTLTVTNQGNSPVTGVVATAQSPVTVSSSTCTGQTLQPGAKNSCAVTFSFTQSVTGPFSRTGALTANSLTSVPAPLAFNANLQTRTIAAVAPASLSYGLSSTQFWSDAKTVTVTNTGTARIVPQVAGRDPSTGVIAATPWIRILSSTCATGIDTGATCSFEVQVKPSLASAMSATVTIYPDTGMVTQGKTFTVAADGVPQSYSASTTTLDFGTVGSLQTVDRSIAFTNTSPAGTSVTGFTHTITQPETGTISVVTNTCSTIASQGSCTVTYRYTAPSYPSATPLEVKGAVIRAHFSGAKSTAQAFPVPITIVGSDITIANDGLDFGAIPVGQAPATATRKVTTLTNTGAYPVTVAHITLAPNTLKLEPDVSVANRCIAGYALAAGASCKIALYPAVATYTETSGVKSATLSVGMGDRSGSHKALVPVTYTGTLNPVTLDTEFTAMDFGVVGENTTTSKTFTFTVSHGGYAYTQIGLTGAKFSASNSCQIQWAPAGTQCTVTVTVAPGATVGNLSGVVTIYASTEGISKPIIVGSVFAQVEPMSLTIEQNDLSFGDTPAQTEGYSRYAVVKNSSAKGVAALTVGSMYTSNTYSLLRNDSATEIYTYDGKTLKSCGSGKSSLNPGELCYVNVRTSGNYGGASSGAYAGTTTISSNTSAGNLNIPVSANFLLGSLEVSAPAVQFETPTPSASAHSPDRTVTVTNNGLGRLYLMTQSITVSGNFHIVKSDGTLVQGITPGGSQASTLCEKRNHLEPGQSCDLNIRFVPQGSAGPRTGTLTVRGSTPAVLSKTVELSGEALAAVVYVNTTQDMGRVLVGSTVTKSFVIGNGGNTALNLKNFFRASMSSATANYSTELTATHNCPASLAPGSECVVNITFSPDQNLNWGTLGNKESFRFDSLTNGVWQTSQVALTGEGYGSELTSDISMIPLGFVDVATVSQDLDVTVTYTASGLAPVRITGFAPSVGHQLSTRTGGTCTSGLTLQPGSTCTVRVTNSTNFTGYSSVIGQSDFPASLFTFSINGSYYYNGTLTQNKYALLKSTATFVSPMSVTAVTPNAIHNTENTEVSVYGSNFRPDVSAKVGATSVPVSYKSSTKLVVTVPAGLPLGSVSITLKPTGGFSGPLSAAVTVIPGVTITNPTAKVHTLDPGEPVNTYNEGVLDQALLQDGRKIILLSKGSYSVLRLADTQGAVLSDISAVGDSYYIWYPDGRSMVSGSLAVSGNTVRFATMLSGSGTQCGSWCTAVKSAGVIYGETTISGQSLTTPTIVNMPIVPLTASSADVSGAVSVTSLDNKGAVAYQATVGGVSYAAVKLVGPTSVTATATVTGTTGVSSAVGLARNQNTLYARHGAKIRAYDVSTGQLSLQSEYNYPNELVTDSAKGLAYSESSASLVTSCYSGTVLCAIPVVETALGSAGYLAGSNGVAGYVDGEYMDARLSIARVSQGLGNLVLFRQSTNPRALRAVQVLGDAIGAVQISSSAIDFGSLSVLSSATAAAMLMNSGSTEVNLLSAPSLTGSSAFSAQGTTCQGSLLPGQSCVVSLKFSPTSAGVSAGSLSFSTNFGVVTSSLSGTGIAYPQVAVDVASLDFGNVNLGSQGTKTLNVSNTGNVPLTTVSVQLLGAGYSTSNNCPATLAVNATCQVTVVLTPTSRQGFSGSMTVGYGGASAQVTQLSGTGVGPALVVDAATQDFGTVAIGATTTSTYTVSNIGTLSATLAYSSLPSTVVRSGTCGASLLPASSCTVILAYSPNAAGSFSGTVTVSAAGTSVALNYTGVGVELGGITVLHLSGQGAAGSTQVIDATGKSEFSRSGTVTVNASGYEAGGLSFTSGNLAYRSPAFQVGANNWTLEWRQKGSASVMQISLGAQGTYSPFATTNSVGYSSTSGASWQGSTMSMGGTPDPAVWTHYAVVRNGPTFNIYKNGVYQSGYTPGAAALTTVRDSELNIGMYSTAFTGQLDDFRFTTNQARYTANFTPGNY